MRMGSRKISPRRILSRRTDRKVDAPSDRPGSATPPPASAPIEDYRGMRRLLNPLWCYHGFRLSVITLTCFGVIMVFSSSSVIMVSAGLSPWHQAITQCVYCVIGIVAGVAAMHMPVDWYRRFAGVLLGLAVVLQLITFTPLGVSVNGNAGWVGIPGKFTMQPAEFMKLMLCIWLPRAMQQASQRFKRDGMVAYVWPAFFFGVCLLTVLGGKDVGTAMILVIIGAAAFLVGGFPLRWLLGIFGVLALSIGVIVVSSPNRMNRILAAYQSCTNEQAQKVCYQAIRAKYAMASGGFFGVGIGNSKEKWNYLPEAHNDFIFAIIGEETGFLGAALVILLFVVLGWCLICVAMRTRDRYAAVVMVCIATWIVGQGLVNIMVVVGLLPVMGVPLPFVSAGGSSLIMCLMAAGVAISMMRSQDQIRDYATALSS